MSKSNLDILPDHLLQQYIFGYLSPKDLANVSGTCKNLKENANIYATHQNRLLEQAAKASYSKFDISRYTKETPIETYDNILPYVCLKLVRYRHATDLNKFKQEHNLAVRLCSLITRHKKRRVIMFLEKAIMLVHNDIIRSLAFNDDNALNFHLSQILIMLMSPILEIFPNRKTKRALLSEIMKDLHREYIHYDFPLKIQLLILKIFNECDVKQLKTSIEIMIRNVEQFTFDIKKIKRLSTIFPMLRIRTTVAHRLWSKHNQQRTYRTLRKITRILLESSINSDNEKEFDVVLRNMCLDKVNREYMFYVIGPIKDQTGPNIQKYLNDVWKINDEHKIYFSSF